MKKANTKTRDKNVNFFYDTKSQLSFTDSIKTDHRDCLNYVGYS